MKLMEEEVRLWLVTGAQSPGCLALPAATPVATLFPQQPLRFQGAVSGLKTSVLREYRQVLRRVS